MRLATALQQYLVQLDADGRSVHTRHQCARHIRRLETWLAGEGFADDVTAIDHETLARFLASPSARCTPSGQPKREFRFLPGEKLALFTIRPPI